MEMKLFILFVVMNIVNVIIQTVKSIATIKCGKTVAAIINAVAYGLYTYIVVLTMCNLPLLAKCLIVAGANFVGVFVVKLFEEKARKDKLWRIECTAWYHDTESIHKALERIPHNYIEDVGPWTIFNIYTQTKAQSERVKEILSHYDVHYFVSESKTL